MNVAYIDFLFFRVKRTLKLALLTDEIQKKLHIDRLENAVHATQVTPKELIENATEMRTIRCAPSYTTDAAACRLRATSFDAA